jgi:uncharacterized protein
MIEEIIKLREDGLSFRKIASELNTTIGRVQYRWNKWLHHQQGTSGSLDKIDPKAKMAIPSANLPAVEFVPVKGELQAKLVSPRKTLLFWEVSEIPEKIISTYFNRRFDELVHVVRVYDVTEINFNGKNAHHYYEIAVPYKNGYWFIKGLVSNRSYIAELGVKFNNESFFPLLRSNSIQTPTLEISNGSEIYHDLAHYQQHEDSPPKWIDHVSTYSYYGIKNIGAEK